MSPSPPLPPPIEVGPLNPATGSGGALSCSVLTVISLIVFICTITYELINDDDDDDDDDTRPRNRHHKSTPFSVAGLWLWVFVSYASELVISGGENKRIEVIFDFVWFCALHWTDD